MVEGPFALGERRRIKGDQIKRTTLSTGEIAVVRKLGEIIYRISAGKVDGCFRIDGTILFVEPRLVLCQLKGDIGDIDTADVGGVTGGIEAERPDVTEAVEGPPFSCVLGPGSRERSRPL